MDNVQHKVLFLSYDGLTDQLGQSQILPYICGLSEKGYRFTIISFEKQAKYKAEKNKIETICAKYSIDWHPLRYHKYPPIFSTLFDVMQLRIKAKKLQKKNNYKIIHCRSYLTSLVGLWMKHVFSVKFIFDMRGFWADERVDGGLWDLKNPLYKAVYNFFKQKEILFLTNADHVISLTENAKKQIQTWVSTARVTVIPCCVDLDLFDPAIISEQQKKSLRIELGLSSDDFVLLYLGSLGTWYLLSEMLDFFSELKEKRINARFLFITSDSLDIGDYKYKKDIIAIQSPRDKVPLYISLTQASIMFIKPVFSKKASSATKMAEVLAMGVPVITNAGWGDVSIFEDKFQKFVTINNSFDYSKAIEILNETTDYESIRNSASHFFSLSTGIKSYSDIYETLL